MHIVVGFNDTRGFALNPQALGMLQKLEFPRVACLGGRAGTLEGEHPITTGTVQPPSLCWKTYTRRGWQVYFQPQHQGRRTQMFFTSAS